MSLTKKLKATNPNRMIRQKQLTTKEFNSFRVGAGVLYNAFVPGWKITTRMSSIEQSGGWMKFARG